MYIIECRDGTYYTGLTWNIAKRMDQHRTRLGSDFTAIHGFKTLRYLEEHNDLAQARKREYQLKDFSRKKKEALWKGKEVLTTPACAGRFEQ